MTWRKSTYSNGENSTCVEAASPRAGLTLIRDSKDPNGPRLAFSSKQLGRLLDGVKRGEYNL